MASVNNLLSRIHDAEGTLTGGNIPAGGQAPAANLDIFLQGSQSLGRRLIVTATTEGLALVDSADNDCSAAGCHVGVWIWVTHFAVMDDLRIALCTGTTPASNYRYWTVPLSEYPALGGWKRVWLENGVGGTVGAGTYTPSQTRCYGMMVSFSVAPGGNAANVIIDAADYIVGAALSLTGATGLWSDFATADKNSSNQYGVFREVGGVYNCFARVQLGSASSLVFSDSGFAIIFPQQSLVSDTFMGINIDLQHASTNIDWAAGVIKSAGAKKGDIVATGTAGDFDATGMTLDSLRLITLTSACSLINSTISRCGLLTQGGATLTNCLISNSIDTASVLASNPSAISGCTFESDGSNHALELPASCANQEYDLVDCVFNGYAAADGDTGNEAIYNHSGGHVTINVSGCSGNIKVRNSSGSTTDIVVSATLTVTGLVAGSDVVVYAAGTTTVRDSADSVNSYQYLYTIVENIDIGVFKAGYVPFYIRNYALDGNNASVPVNQEVDRAYLE